MPLLPPLINPLSVHKLGEQRLGSIGFQPVRQDDCSVGRVARVRYFLPLRFLNHPAGGGVTDDSLHHKGRTNLPLSHARYGKAKVIEYVKTTVW